MQQRHIIDVDEQNIEKWQQYFANRHGIDITDKIQQYLSGEPVETLEVRTAEEVTEEVPEDTSDDTAEEAPEGSADTQEADSTEDSDW